MTKEQKREQVDILAEVLEANKTIYLADIEGMNAEDTSALRRTCFENGIQIQVVKNTLLRKAMEAVDKDMEDLYGLLKGNTSMMVCETANVPAKTIKDFAKKNTADKPVFKGAWIDESTYVGADQLETLVNLKSKEELIGEVIGLLQSPAKNVISALQSGGNTLSGLVKTLSERAE
ncbi:MAG: 50S ribosomal protein L10 [Flavobacteriales bacterium]